MSAPFEQAQKLKEKRARYNGVSDILNPPKEEQALDSDGGDGVQYQRRKHSGKDIRDDIYYPKNSRDAHAFIRSYADQTNGMRDGETKNVFVTTADHAYFVRATGYLKGDIEIVLPILGNENLINGMRKEFRNVTYTGAETFDTWSQTIRSNRGRDDWDHAATEYTRVSGRNDAVDDGQSGNDTFGSDWESFGYSSWEEMMEAVEGGAMFLDDDGNIIAKQYQQRTNTLTNREVLDLVIIRFWKRIPQL